MRTRLLKPNLFSHLINFDFFFFDSPNKCHLSPYSDFKVNPKIYSIYLLNMVEQFKSFKQFFRLLQFLKKRNLKSFLQIVTPFEKNEIFLKSILHSNITQKPKQSVITSFAKLKYVSSPLKMLLLLDFSALQTSYIYNCASRNKFFLVQTINYNFEPNSLACYKILNSLFNYKRLVFVGIIINRILK
jgi:hypothetical protein